MWPGHAAPDTFLGLAAEIEREFIALRTRQAAIRGYLAKGINKLAIAKLIECAPSTLYAWLARRHFRPSRGAARVQAPSVTP